MRMTPRSIDRLRNFGNRRGCRVWGMEQSAAVSRTPMPEQVPLSAYASADPTG